MRQLLFGCVVFTAAAFLLTTPQYWLFAAGAIVGVMYCALGDD